MGSIGTKRVLCWTIGFHRKPGLDEAEFHRYMSEVHAPLAKDFMVKYGMLGYFTAHNESSMRPLMGRIISPEFHKTKQGHFLDFDAVVTMTFPDVECVERLKKDPEYREKVMPDHHNFADMEANRTSIGWLETHILDGKAVRQP